MKDLQDANVRIGWFESSKYPDEAQTPVAYVAAINELGPHARPFMKPTADARDREWADLMLNLARQIVKGRMTVEDGLTALGLQVGADIQYTIAHITAPELSLITLLARKARLEGEKVTGATIGQFAARVKADADKVRQEVSGISDKPLNETGYMLATTSFSVNMGDAQPVKDE